MTNHLARDLRRRWGMSTLVSRRLPGSRTTVSTSVRLALAIAVLVFSTGCTGLGRWVDQGFKVGPDYCSPPAPVEDKWIDYENPDVSSVSPDYGNWWSVFGDPTLDQMIETASQQNLTLQTAGMRILEARARFGSPPLSSWTLQSPIRRSACEGSPTPRQVGP